MPLIINPYDELDNNMQGTPTINGTWTYVGSGSTGAPPLPPNPPATYNGTLDFTGVNPGTYEYEYTTPTNTCRAAHSAILTITKYNYTPVPNDVCADSLTIAFPYNGGTNSRIEETNQQTCPGQAYPTDSGVAIPTQWGSGPFQGDMWYKVSYTTSTTPPISMTIEVDGSNYSTQGINQPLLAVYSGSCGSLVLEAAASSSTNKVSLMFDSIFGSNFTYYIRVACHLGNEGKFDVNVTVQ